MGSQCSFCCFLLLLFLFLFPGGVLDSGGLVARKRVLQRSFEFLERLDDRKGCTHEETVAIVKP